MIVGRTLLVPRGEAATRLVPVAEPRKFVAFAIAAAVAGPGALLSGLAGTCVPDPLATQSVPHLTTTIGFVTNEPAGAAFRPPWPQTLHAAGHALGKDHRFMPLAWRQQQGEELPRAVSPEVDCRAEAPCTTPPGFGLGIPCFAPAACW